jgi:4-hydroxybenzoate polyprenyltransferase
LVGKKAASYELIDTSEYRIKKNTQINMKYLKLIRYKNLLFIIVLQYLMRYAIIEPMMRVYDIAMETNSLHFTLLVLASVFIAAAGYVINDYFDTRIDAINRPDDVIVGISVSKEQAMLMHQILTGIGVIAGLWVAFAARSLTVGLVMIMVPGLLWFYSASYKRQFLIGNLIVALLSAFIPLIVVQTESAFLQKKYNELIMQTPLLPQLYGWVCGFALFAFLLTWIREIVKDMQDEEGDREMECRTMPIKWGIKNTKFFLYGLIAITVGLLSYANFSLIHFPNDTLSTRYLIFGLYLPFAYLCFLIFKARTSPEFKQAATFTKFIMIIGMLYSVIFYFLLAKNFGISFFNVFTVQ